MNGSKENDQGAVSEEVINFSKQMRKEFFKYNKLNFVLCIFFAVVQAIMAVFMACLFQMIIDVAAQQSFSGFIKVFIGMLSYVLISFLFLMAEREIKNNFFQRGLEQYKEFAFEKMLSNNIGSYANESTSTYLSALTNDINTIETDYLQSLTAIIYNVVSFVTAIIVMIKYSPLMTFIAISLSSIPMIVATKSGTKLVDVEKNVSDENGQFVANIGDMLSGFPVIKSFKAEKQVIRQFYAINTRLEVGKNNKRKMINWIEIIAQTSGNFVHLSVFGLGAFLALKGKISLGVVIAFIQLMNNVLSPANILPALFAKCSASNALIIKLANALLDSKSRIGTEEKNALYNSISIQNLTFGYEANKTILNNISLDFEMNKSYAIVGMSGSGKSTIMNLLLGGYDNYEGNIMYDDIELRNLTENSLYDLVTIIQQNVFVFDSTVADNITMYGYFHPIDIASAIEKSGLSTLINEKGENYRCGENGSGLSGGERQRISIARALLRNSPILLLDEATAALDAQTSYLVENSILDLEDKLRIVVTHKLQEEMLRRYDEIIVLNDGCVIEKGSYEDLYALRGRFYSMMEISK